MTSTSFNTGMHLERNSSRVLKPPGGGHTELFGGSEGEGEPKVINARPKYDQQNSSNLNFCMNTPDPNLLVQQKKKEKAEVCQPKHDQLTGAAAQAQQPQDQSRSRVPPGGFSSGGFW